MKIQSLCKWLLPAAAGVTLLASVGYAAYPAAAPYVSSPAPLNQARIWFYREANPYDGIGLPYLRLNGTVVGVSQPGAAFFVDVPPGHYHLSADSYGEDFNQTRDIDIGPGQVAFAKVLSNEQWFYGGGGRRSGGYQQDTYYVWTLSPQAAVPVIAQSYLYGNTAQFSGSPYFPR
jgi:hypothetical protein